MAHRLNPEPASPEQEPAAAGTPTNDPLVSWTVYDHPLDYPNGYIARKWLVVPGQLQPTDETLTDETLAGLRKKLPEGLTQIPRSAMDDPRIVETWI